MKSYLLAFLSLLLTNCASTSLSKEKSESVNNSALYDPPVVTLKPGVTYPFQEGDLLGRGQSFMSGYTYFQNALLK
jgi:hypothetical protein